MEQIAKLLRQAYNTIREADTSDIDAFYLAVEEAQGFIAEALDKADNPEVNPKIIPITLCYDSIEKTTRWQSVREMSC